MRRCTIGLRPRSFIVLRQCSPASTGFVHLPKSLSRPLRTRSQSRRQHLLFSAGTWRHLLWQIYEHAFSALRAALPKCLLGGALRRCPLRVSTVVRHLPAMGVHRLRSQLWHRPTTFSAPKPVASNTARPVGRRRCLTLRSSLSSTAFRTGHQALGLRSILRLLPSAPRRRRQLTSNVMPQRRVSMFTEGLRLRVIGAVLLLGIPIQ